MRPFVLIVRFRGGGPLVGGATAAPIGFHASHAQLPDGRPYLPATALRGALRESFEAVLRGTGEHRACSGGDGIDPDAVSGEVPPRSPGPCALGEGGAPCLACRLFGTRRAGIDKGDRSFSALVLGDALPEGDVTWTTRPSVALDRARRSAADQQLIFRRIPAATGGGPLLFKAQGRVSAPTFEGYLAAAVRATTHIGAGRSRGLAAVDLEVVWREAAAASAQSTSIRGAERDLLLRVTLTSPALVGASIIDANYRETRYEIPGSAVRGAVGFALRELLEDADADRATQDLLDLERGAKFGFLYPVDLQLPHAAPATPGAIQITAAACKQHGRAHGITDTLLDRLVLRHATSADEAESAMRRAAVGCARCKSPLRAVHGSRRAGSRPKTRTVVRVSMDRTRQSARDGQLFSQVLLAPGAVFEGTIRGIPSHARKRLLEALHSGVISFGRGRSAGWGQARIDIERAPAQGALKERAAAFDRALRARLEDAGLSTARVGRLVPVTLLSPLWPSACADASGAGAAGAEVEDGVRDLLAATGAESCFLAARRFARDGAWDQRTGQMSTFRATAAGGVFVLELGSRTWRDVLERLEALERDGAGQRRDQGYGQVLCFDPHFLISPQNG